MGETVTITYEAAGLSPQGGRWKVRHELFKSNGKKAVIINLEGTILDLSTRKPALPTPELFQILNLIPRAADFETLSDSHWR